MRVILFGAGASYGSESVYPYPPPLGAGLFDELQKHYPKVWGTIPASDRTKFVPNFELGMKEVWDSSSHVAPVLMRCLADYFARFRAGQSNVYARLLECLQYYGALEGTVFSSLNYECVLETAARNYGISRIEYFEKSTTGASVLTVWKLHGSCNFLPESVVGDASAVSYSGAAVSWDGEMRIVDPVHVGPFVSQNAFYPAMAVFMEGKPIHSHQTAIKEIQTRWRAAITESDIVGIIGVFPNETDTHLWDPLSDTSAAAVVIGDVKAYEGWKTRRRVGKRSEIVGDQFARDLPKFAEVFAKT
jgi:hypothetical protein